MHITLQKLVAVFEVGDEVEKDSQNIKVLSIMMTEAL